jgi:hypothetical protein
MKSLWQPQTLRSIHEFVTRTVSTWDQLTPEEKASGDFINPDEPIVLRVPNPEWEEGEDGPYAPDDFGNDTHLHYHVESHGGGADLDEDGRECGHDGAMFTGMDMDSDQFLCNGRRRKAKKT